MKTLSVCIVLILSSIFFFGCKSKSLPQGKPITIVISDVYQIQDIYGAFVDLDMALSTPTKSQPVVEAKPEQEPTGEITLEGQLSAAPVQEPERDYPLFSIMMPPTARNDQGQNVLASTCFVGYALAKDTAMVNKHLSSPQAAKLLPYGAIYKWLSASQVGPDILGLVALKPNHPPKELSDRYIRSIEVGEGGGIGSLMGVSLKKEYYVMLNLKADLLKQFDNWKDPKENKLLKVEMNGRTYYSPLTMDKIEEGILLEAGLSTAAADSIKGSYAELVEEK